MRYKVVQYSTANDTEVIIGSDDILIGIDSDSNVIIVLRFIRARES